MHYKLDEEEECINQEGEVRCFKERNYIIGETKYGKCRKERKR